MTHVAIMSGAAAAKAADAVVDDLISAALSGGDRARLTKAPAGAGKTGAVTRLVDALAEHMACETTLPEFSKARASAWNWDAASRRMEIGSMCSRDSRSSCPND